MILLKVSRYLIDKIIIKINQKWYLKYNILNAISNSLAFKWNIFQFILSHKIWYLISNMVYSVDSCNIESQKPQVKYAIVKFLFLWWVIF